jgi:hypothetical protein
VVAGVLEMTVVFQAAAEEAVSVEGNVGSASTPGGQTGMTLRFPVGMSFMFIRGAVPHISVPRRRTAWCRDAQSWYTALADPLPIATPSAGPPSMVHTRSCDTPYFVWVSKQAIRPEANIWLTWPEAICATVKLCGCPSS